MHRRSSDGPEAMSPSPSETATAKTALLVGVCILLSPLMLFIAAVLYTTIVPAHSAEFYIDEIDTTVALKFYWRWSDTNGDGRYLTVRAPHGQITQDICGYDWAHWSRTSIYLTPEHTIAVIGPDQCEYLVTIDPLGVSDLRGDASEQWTYLGAFDLAGYPHGGRGPMHLRFLRATEQDECLTRGAQPLTPRPDRPRASARDRNCPFPPEN